MKKAIFFLILFCALIPVSLFADTIFLKDGSIIDGTVLSENNRAVFIKKKKGNTITIIRIKILRIHYGDPYLNKQIIKLSSGMIVEAYIVDEDTTSYTIRKKLETPEESKIKKKDVLQIIRDYPSNLTGTVEWPGLRLSWNKPAGSITNYQVFLTKKGTTFPAKPFTITEKTHITTKKLATGFEYTAYVIGINIFGKKTQKSNTYVISLLTPPISKLRCKKKKSGKDAKVFLNWEKPENTSSKTKRYHVYEKTKYGNKQIGTTDKNQYIVSNLKASHHYTFTVRAETVTGEISHTAAPVSTSMLDPWYVIMLGSMAVPLGEFTKGISAGGGLTFAGTNSLDSFWHFGSAFGFSYLPGLSSVPGESMMFYSLDAFTGLNIPLNRKTIFMQPYVALGGLITHMTYKSNLVDSSISYDFTFSIGLRFHVKAFVYLVPYIEYKWVPDASKHYGILYAGLGVAL